jgi:uncharacterized protein YvpB
LATLALLIVAGLGLCPSAASADPARFVPNLPLFHQAFSLSCEAASLRMALAKEGIATTDQAILNLTPADPRPAQLTPTGMRWGDPYAAYVGDPSGSEVTLTGYGTYYPTIAAVAAQLGGHVLRADEHIAASDIYAAAAAGHPVVAWITYQWVVPARQDYTAFDGRTIPYAGPVEHSVTVAGVWDDSVLVNNPITGQEWISKPVFEAAFAIYNNMAVILD